VRISDIKRITVDWMEKFGNNPMMEFVLKRDRKLTPRELFRWYQSGNLFYSEHEGEVRYLVHDRSDHNGFGCARFSLHMAEGWEETKEGREWRDCSCIQHDWGSRCDREVSCRFDRETRILTLQGPWSSGQSVVSSIIGPVVAVSTLEGPSRTTVNNPDWYHRQKRQGRAYVGTAFATSYTLAFVQEVVDILAPHLWLYEGDFSWYPVRKGDYPKNPNKGKRNVPGKALVLIDGLIVMETISRQIAGGQLLSNRVTTGED